MNRFLVILCVVVGALAATRTAQAALQIQRVVSPGGIEAWLVEDHHVPILALDMVVRGGSALDPPGKEGLALMTASLLDEGAGDLDSTEFQKELADKSIALSFGADLDNFSGSLKTLTRYRDRAFDLLALALEKPRFDADAVERIRDQMVTSLAGNLGNPNWVARRKVMETVFAGHPYSRPTAGTIESIRAIGVDDLRQWLATRIGRDQLLITAAGDITPAELGPALDRIFAALPDKAAPFAIPEIAAQGAGETIKIPMDEPQTIVSLAGAGMERKDPDWYAGQVLNYAFGGGGFNSRLMEDVRGSGTKRGLSYGVYSAITPLRHSGLIQAGGATRNATAGATLKVILDEFARTYRDGVTDAEIKDAKTYITGSFPLSLTSTDRLAAILMQLRSQDLGIDYLNRRDSLIQGVTSADVKRVATRLLDPAKLTTILVGKPEGLEQGALSPAPVIR
jgi:zinc protease